MLRAGSTWRLLLQELPSWQPTCHYFWDWRPEETWQQKHHAFLVPVRQATGREATPSGAVIDSQSVITTGKWAKVRLRKVDWGFIKGGVDV